MAIGAPERIVSIEGGMAFNVIPDKAKAVLKFEGELPEEAEEIEVSAENGLLTVNAFGKAGHASMPEGKVNAIGVLVNYILDNNLCSEAEAEYLAVLKALHSCPYGTGIGVDADDHKFSPLTIIGGIIGIVVSVKEDTVVIETGSDRSKIRILKSAVSQNISAKDKND